MAGRLRSRLADQAESYYILLELCCCEPIIQQAFSIIENVCLSHGLTATAQGRGLKDDFQRHIDQHWIPFLSAAIRAMFVYGFVPYRKRKLESGDYVPEVLPPGTFRWTVEVSKDNDAMLSYKVQLNPGARMVQEIFIEEYIQPNYMVNENSVLYSTVASPMSYVIESYKNLQSAIKRSSYSDAWNTTARLIVSHEPKEFQHSQNQKEIFRTFDAEIPEYGTYGVHQRRREDTAVEDCFQGRPTNHTPVVHPLPAFRKLENTPVLHPTYDIPFLQVMSCRPRKCMP